MVWTRLCPSFTPAHHTNKLQIRPSHANLRFCPLMNNELRNHLLHTVAIAVTAVAAVAERTSANVNMYMHVHASDLASRTCILYFPMPKPRPCMHVYIFVCTVVHVALTKLRQTLTPRAVPPQREWGSLPVKMRGS